MTTKCCLIETNRRLVKAEVNAMISKARKHKATSSRAVASVSDTESEIIVATPTPKPKMKRKAPEVLESDEDGDMWAKPELKKKREEPLKNHPEPGLSLVPLRMISHDTFIVFRILIPSPDPDGSNLRRPLKAQATFTDLKDLVFETLECKDFAVKPDMSYLIGGASKGNGPISLHSDDDWTCCLQDLNSAHFSCPKTKQLFPLDLVIVIKDQVCIIYLSATFLTIITVSSITLCTQKVYQRKVQERKGARERQRY